MYKRVISLNSKEELIKFRNVRNEFIIRLGLTLDEDFLRKNEDPKYLYLVDNTFIFDFKTKNNLIIGMIYSVEWELLSAINEDKFFEYGFMPENIKVVRDTSEEPFFEHALFKTPEKLEVGYSYLNTMSVFSYLLENYSDAEPDQFIDNDSINTKTYDEQGNVIKEEHHTKNELIATLNQQTAAILDTTVPEPAKTTEPNPATTTPAEKPEKKDDNDKGGPSCGDSPSQADLYIGPRGSY